MGSPAPCYQWCIDREEWRGGGHTQPPGSTSGFTTSTSGFTAGVSGLSDQPLQDTLPHLPAQRLATDGVGTNASIGLCMLEIHGMPLPAIYGLMLAPAPLGQDRTVLHHLGQQRGGRAVGSEVP